MFLGKHGYGKKNVLSNIRTLIVKCEEETKWWRAVQTRYRAIVGKKPAMNVDEFERVVCLGVSFVDMGLTLRKAYITLRYLSQFRGQRYPLPHWPLGL